MVKVAGKNCDKFITATVRVRCSKLRGTVIIMLGRKEACRSAGKACRLCSWSGFVSSSKQNREFQYASEFRASRLKVRVRSWYVKNWNYSLSKKRACRSGGNCGKQEIIKQGAKWSWLNQRLITMFCRNVVRASGKKYKSWQLFITETFITPNGAAIKGACVTRRKHRVVPISIGTWFFSREIVTVLGGYGAVFAVMVEILLSHMSVAVQGW